MTEISSDVIVIGVGGMGSAATAELACRGVDVLGIERYDIPHARGSSHGVNRIIRRQQFEDPVYVPLVERAFEGWEALEETHDRQLLYRVGSVDFGPADGDIVEDSKRSCEDHGIEYELLTGAELTGRFPGYEIPEDYRALYQADGGFVHSEQGIVAHVEAAHAHGGVVHAREQVESWDASESGVTVETDRGKYTAETLVVTAGAWTGRLLPTFADVLTPNRQVLGWLQPTDPSKFERERCPVWVAETPDREHYYGFPVFEIPGFKFGYFDRQAETGTPASLSREPDREDERVLREFAEQYFPAANGPTMRLSTCMFTHTPDEDFIIDSHPDHENVIVGAGFSGHGYKFTPVIGEILADLALDGETDHSLDSFAFARFD